MDEVDAVDAAATKFENAGAALADALTQAVTTFRASMAEAVTDLRGVAESARGRLDSEET